MSDILKKISDDDLENLRDLFKANWPQALHAYYWLDNYIDWKKRKITDINFYCPEGRWDDGTFIAIEEQHPYIFIFSLEQNCKRLKNALEKTHLIKWNKHNMFCAVHENHQPTLMNQLKNRDIIDLDQDIGNMWWINKEYAVNYEYMIPSEVYLAPLKEQDVDKIDSVWPHRSSNSKFYLKQLIIYNGGFGLYLKNDENILCSWIMRNNYGGMAILQTDVNHVRKGYGTILAKHFSKYWAEKGLDIFCFIMTHNKPSQTLFEKLGWKKSYGVTWSVCNSTDH